MTDGFSKLGNVLSTHVNNQITKGKDVALELGIINSDMSITLDALPDIVIPTSDYFIDRVLTMANPMCSTQQGGADNHMHIINVPAKLSAIKSNDRVLIAWTMSNIPVIIAVVVKGGS